MKTKSPSETNPYLKNPAQRKKFIARSVRTSSGVEGIKEKANNEQFIIPQRKGNSSLKILKIKH